MPRFLGWQRPQLFRTAVATPQVTARVEGRLPVDLDDAQGTVTGSAPFLIAGPGDVLGVARERIGLRVPAPGQVDAESTKLASVELLDPDLPWRYSPVANPPLGTGVVRPWLVLVVGTPTEVVVEGPRVTLRGAQVFAQHPLDRSGQWAHVHDVDGRRFARLVSPRDLRLDAQGNPTTGLDLVAALVPGWRVSLDADGAPQIADSWHAGSGEVTLPAYDMWTFRTHPEPGDFASIAARLEPLTTTEQATLTQRDFGRARVAVTGVPGAVQTTSGALSATPPPGQDPIEGPLDPAVEAAVEPLTQDVPGADPWVLTAPRYDSPWHPGPVDGEDYVWPLPGDDVVPDGWRRQLRTEPRYRGAAGLGAWNAIAWQDRITDAAAAQAGAVALAASRIRHLVAGLQAAGFLWRSRMPSDPVARLAVLGPMLARVPAEGGGSVLDAAAGRTPLLRAGLFSSAAQRLVRRRSSVRREAGAAANLPGLLEAANRCPPEPAVDDGDRMLERELQDPAVLESLRGQLERAFGELVEALEVDEQTLVSLGNIVNDADGIAEAAGLLARSAPESTCRPLDLGAFAGSVAEGVDPTVAWPVAAGRVLDGITGLRPPLLAEPETAPEIDLPLWSFLNDHARDWMLPGAGDIPADRVLPVQTNPVFVDAYLVGASHQTLGELRWRNLPITTRWTPLRRFWQRIDPDLDAVATDIKPVVSLASDAPVWPHASTLGDPSHLTTNQPVALVVVLHTTLFRRYPSTQIYLTPHGGGADPWRTVPPLDGPAAVRRFPIFAGRLTADLRFYGFDLPPSAIRTHWVVLEEPPRGFRFYHPTALPAGEQAPTPGDDAATYAEKTFAEPVRVFLGNLS